MVVPHISQMCLRDTWKSSKKKLGSVCMGGGGRGGAGALALRLRSNKLSCPI